LITCGAYILLSLAVALANWSQDALWGLCNALLGPWFVVDDVLAFLGELKGRVLRQVTIVPVITPLLYGMCAAIAPLMAVALWLSAFDSRSFIPTAVPRLFGTVFLILF
jgi:hypothetical protein